MGFICIDNGRKKYSFSYDESQWLELKKQYKDLALTMPCCHSSALPKTSKLGTQFFTHTSSAQCSVPKKSGETVYHQFCKYIVSKILFEQGWEVEFEKPGTTPNGEDWIADVYATKNNKKIVIEVQWSRQNVANTKNRHQKYLESGINRVVWLYRSQKPFLQFEDHYKCQTAQMPIFFINFNDEARQIEVKGFKETFDIIKDDHSPDTIAKMELSAFIKQLFAGNIIHSTNQKAQFYTAISTYMTTCWRCQTPTNVVHQLLYALGHQKEFYTYKVVDFKDCFLHQIEHLNHIDLRNKYKYGLLKNRYSNTEKRSYLSNGCWSCGALLGRHFNQHESTLATHQISEYIPIPQDQPLDLRCVYRGHWLLIKPK